MRMNNSLGAAYLAAEGFEKQLTCEISGITKNYGRLFLTDSPPQRTYWAQNIWYQPFLAHFETIGQAAKILKDLQRNWALFPHVEHRRAALIKEKLPYLSNKPLLFPTKTPDNELGSWTLLDKNTLLASAQCRSKWPNGEIIFQEQKFGPPSRAYLKLWEALTLCGKLPCPKDKCLEIGASPGGWSWVIAQTGANVLCIDRSPLAENVLAMPGVTFKNGNAFSFTPDVVGYVEWIFSDVACYPEKLLEWVKLWLKSGKCSNFICTLKFQGEANYEIAKEFEAIPGSQVVHLSHNKHELTWILTATRSISWH